MSTPPEGAPPGDIPLAIPVMDRIPTLPYWSAYAVWSEHLSMCEHCLDVMSPGGGSEMVCDLCPDGQAYATLTDHEIMHQAEISRLN